MLATGLLIVAVALLAAFVVRDARDYRRFKTLADTRARQRQYRLWIATTFVFFVGYTLLTLVLLGRLDALAAMPAEFADLSGRLRDALPASGMSGDFMAGIAIGIFGAAIAGGIVARRSARRDAPPTLGDIDALMPRNRTEAALTAVLSINAGVTEELFFRLTLPLLLTLVTGDALAAFVVAGLLFGLAHLYQGWVGVIATTAVGAALAVLYLATGMLWIAVAVHALIDIVALVVRPALAGRLSSSAATPS